MHRNSAALVFPNTGSSHQIPKCLATPPILVYDVLGSDEKQTKIETCCEDFKRLEDRCYCNWAVFLSECSYRRPPESERKHVLLVVSLSIAVVLACLHPAMLEETCTECRGSMKLGRYERPHQLISLHKRHMSATPAELRGTAPDKYRNTSHSASRMI